MPISRHELPPSDSIQIDSRLYEQLLTYCYVLELNVRQEAETAIFHYLVDHWSGDDPLFDKDDSPLEEGETFVDRCDPPDLTEIPF